MKFLLKLAFILLVFGAGYYIASNEIFDLEFINTAMGSIVTFLENLIAKIAEMFQSSNLIG